MIDFGYSLDTVGSQAQPREVAFVIFFYRWRSGNFSGFLVASA